MANSFYPYKDYPRSKAHLSRVSPAYTDLYHWLKYDSLEYVHKFEDWLDVFDTNLWTSLESNNGTAFAIPATLATEGVIVGATGTTANDYVYLTGPLLLKGDNHCGVEFRLKVDDVANLKFEVGLIDGAETTGGINDIDTPTATAGDMALFGVDTGQTLKTMAFVTEGSTTKFDVKKTNVSGGWNLTNGNMIKANTYHTFRIQTFGNFVAGWIDGKLMAVHDDSVDPDGCIEGGTLLQPWVFVQTLNTDAKTCTIDYIRYWQLR